MRIAQQFGVSQAPVREALRDLDLLGFVVSSPFRGAIVRQISVEELVQLYPIRAVLEGLAARHAALRIDAATLKKLEGLLATMRTAAARGRSPPRGRGRLCVSSHDRRGVGQPSASADLGPHAPGHDDIPDRVEVAPFAARRSSSGTPRCSTRCGRRIPMRPSARCASTSKSPASGSVPRWRKKRRRSGRTARKRRVSRRR